MRALSDSAPTIPRGRAQGVWTDADGHSVIFSINEILKSGFRANPPPLPAKKPPKLPPRQKAPEKPWVCSPFLVSPPLSAFVEKPPLPPPPPPRVGLTSRSKKLLALAASFALVAVSGIAAATVGGDRVPRPSRARASIEVQTLSTEEPLLAELEPYTPDPEPDPPPAPLAVRPRVVHHAVAAAAVPRLHPAAPAKDEGFTRLPRNDDGFARVASHGDLAPNPF